MVVRGCGTRTQNDLYVCVPMAPWGKPLEAFMQDPPVPWKGASVLRAPALVKDRYGVCHLLMGIGAEFYPYFSDFAEEARKMGVSRKIPKNYNFEALEAGRSKLLLMHPRAIPLFDYRTKHFCPMDKAKRNDPSEILINNIADYLIETDSRADHKCLGATYSLSLIDDGSDKHNIRKLGIYGWGSVITPSCRYDSPMPDSPNIDELKGLKKKVGDLYAPGIILIFPKFHVEYINRNGKYPPELKHRIEKIGFEFKVERE